MKTKDYYLSKDNACYEFFEDIKIFARNKKISVPDALKEFFSKYDFTKKEMGIFALDTSPTHNIVDSAIVLIHTLDMSAEKITHTDFLYEYFGASKTDPSMWSNSWTIDNSMNWPQGTTMYQSLRALNNL